MVFIAKCYSITFASANVMELHFSMNGTAFLADDAGLASGCLLHRSRCRRQRRRGGGTGSRDDQRKRCCHSSNGRKNHDARDWRTPPGSIHMPSDFVENAGAYLTVRR
jgi:hypothetical protein